MKKSKTGREGGSGKWKWREGNESVGRSCCREQRNGIEVREKRIMWEMEKLIDGERENLLQECSEGGR